MLSWRWPAARGHGWKRPTDHRAHLVCLVDNEHAPEARGAHERGIFPQDRAIFENGTQSERRDGGVAVELYVLALS